MRPLFKKKKKSEECPIHTLLCNSDIFSEAETQQSKARPTSGQDSPLSNAKVNST